MIRYVFGVFLISLVGCKASLPIKPVTYEGEVFKTSEKAASIELITGNLVSSNREVVLSGGGLYLPVSGPSYDFLQFGVEDQQIFIDSLSTELVRLGVLNVSNEASDLNIVINFIAAHNNPNTLNYTLEVEMNISSENEKATTKYVVSSNDGYKDALFGTAPKNKTMAGTKLMNLIIPDIQTYLTEHQ
jgi:hypothetical protein